MQLKIFRDDCLLGNQSKFTDAIKNHSLIGKSCQNLLQLRHFLFGTSADFRNFQPAWQPLLPLVLSHTAVPKLSISESLVGYVAERLASAAMS